MICFVEKYVLLAKFARFLGKQHLKVKEILILYLSFKLYKVPQKCYNTYNYNGGR